MMAACCKFSHCNRIPQLESLVCLQNDDTPLILAARLGHYESLLTLLENGAEVEAANDVRPAVPAVYAALLVVTALHILTTSLRFPPLFAERMDSTRGGRCY